MSTRIDTVILPPLKGTSLAFNVRILEGGLIVAMAGKKDHFSKAVPCMWHDALSEKPTVEPLPAKQKSTIVAGADRMAVGQWGDGPPKCGALVWFFEKGRVQLSELPAVGMEATRALACDGQSIIGVGWTKAKKGAQGATALLRWCDGKASQIEVPDPDDVNLTGVSGRQWVGYVGRSGNQRAALWREGQRIDLGQPGEASMATCIDGDTQAGVVLTAVDGLDVARAVRWRGEPSTLVDLTPAGFEVSNAHACRGRWVVGSVRRNAASSEGYGPARDDRAVIWGERPEDVIDLHGALAIPCISSVATGLIAEKHELWVVGMAETADTSDQRAVLWKVAAR